MFSKPPFNDLIYNGFRREADALVGNVNGYSVKLQYVWFRNSYGIYITILFDPRSRGNLLAPEEIRHIEKRNIMKSFFMYNNYELTNSCIVYKMSYSFRPPSAQKIISKAETIAVLLNEEGLKPISPEKMEEVRPEIFSYRG